MDCSYFHPPWRGYCRMKVSPENERNECREWARVEVTRSMTRYFVISDKSVDYRWRRRAIGRVADYKNPSQR